MKKRPVYFLSHGGGPWPWIKDQFGDGTMFNQLEASLQNIAAELGDSVISVLMVTGHWETPTFSISSGEHPPMVYDYHGFPPETYEIQYPAPGDPVLAQQVHELLTAADIRSELDSERGFDHGTFSLMYPMHPNADVKVVQVSIRADYDSEAHLKAGRALAPLRDQGVVIIGSGLSYHNLHAINQQGKTPSAEFDGWLQETLTLDSAERWQQLKQWTNAPSARLAHPQEDHLLPLMVAAGAAGDDRAECVYHEDNFFDHITVSSFRFGEV